VYDILIAPRATIEQAIKEGKVVSDSRMLLGRVGVGVVVSSGVASPNIATVDELLQALLAAESVVYNTASTGIYVDKLVENVGIADLLKSKTTRYANGADVMEHVIKGKRNEIGFGAITEIRLYESKGVRLVGPLPTEVQNYTIYEAALMAGTTSADAARAVFRYLATPAAKVVFATGGVE
jgi:molybdate transport system substrate-binding protein